MRRFAAPALLLLTLNARADVITDMRAAVSQLHATKPIHVSIDVQRSRKNEGRCANQQFTGAASLDVIEDDAGLHIIFPRAVLERADRESREHTADPRKQTPTRAAVNDTQATEIADCVNFAGTFLRLIDTAKKLIETRG